MRCVTKQNVVFSWVSFFYYHGCNKLIKVLSYGICALSLVFVLIRYIILWITVQNLIYLDRWKMRVCMIANLLGSHMANCSNVQRIWNQDWKNQLDTIIFFWEWSSLPAEALSVLLFSVSFVIVGLLCVSLKLWTVWFGVRIACRTLWKCLY